MWQVQINPVRDDWGYQDRVIRLSEGHLPVLLDSDKKTVVRQY